jgi:hypothetical protein
MAVELIKRLPAEMPCGICPVNVTNMFVSDTLDRFLLRKENTAHLGDRLIVYGLDPDVARGSTRHRKGFVNIHTKPEVHHRYMRHMNRCFFFAKQVHDVKGVTAFVQLDHRPGSGVTKEVVIEFAALIFFGIIPAVHGWIILSCFRIVYTERFFVRLQ